MPEISRFFGIGIYIYFEMSIRHHTPHFHVSYGEYDASYSIETFQLLAGQLPRRQERLVLQWARLHQSELQENWLRATAGRSLQSIEPLRK
ncbi:MAG TPA: DUF4160 domain-containing protein [Caldilineaceae bacterium]|nr:DUF4160 domain-containing protein [Caldilineaceae bacterium]